MEELTQLGYQRGQCVVGKNRTWVGSASYCHYSLGRCDGSDVSLLGYASSWSSDSMRSQRDRPGGGAEVAARYCSRPATPLSLDDELCDVIRSRSLRHWQQAMGRAAGEPVLPPKLPGVLREVRP